MAENERVEEESRYDARGLLSALYHLVAASKYFFEIEAVECHEDCPERIGEHEFYVYPFCGDTLRVRVENVPDSELPGEPSAAP